MKTLLPNRILVILLVLLSFSACKQFSGDSETAPVEEAVPEIALPEAKPEEEVAAVEGALWNRYDETEEIAANADHPVTRMRYKLIQSRVLDKNEVFLPLYPEVRKLAEAEYERLKPMVLGKTIPEVQEAIQSNAFSYEDLTRFFLYRIYKYELDNATTLNTVIALNLDVIEEAKRRDAALKADPGLAAIPYLGCLCC